MGILICPKCKQVLQKSPTQYFCNDNHCYDRAKSGYVNLLVQKNSKLPGDNKLMVNARTEFLSKGYYEPLLQALRKLTYGTAVLDVGCGEGYYTDGIKSVCADSDFTGIDISKFALDKAGKRTKKINFAVASAFHLPVANSSCDTLINIFAPFCLEEFSRVIKTNGIMIVVIPAQNHLWELKEIVYPDPYKNEAHDYSLVGFTLDEKVTVTSHIVVDNNEDIMSLFTMTPYYYKTSQAGHDKLANLSTLSTTIDFEILIYKKEAAD